MEENGEKSARSYYFATFIFSPDGVLLNCLQSCPFSYANDWRYCFTHDWLFVDNPHLELAQLASYQMRKIVGCASGGMPGAFSPPTWVSDPGMHRGTCVTHVPWCMPGLLIRGSLWSRWWEKRSQHHRCMRNPQFCVSVKRPVATQHEGMLATNYFRCSTGISVCFFSTVCRRWSRFRWTSSTLLTGHEWYEWCMVRPAAYPPWQQGSLGHHGAHLGPTGSRWAPCWPHELCYLGAVTICKAAFPG